MNLRKWLEQVARLRSSSGRNVMKKAMSGKKNKMPETVNRK